PSQIQQVLLNLILNAEQALTETRHSGTITLTTRAQREEGRVALTIADDGPGIPSEILPRIFDPFFTTKQVGEGTGLGLAVSYGIIRAHGGEISVRSREGEGTAFSLSLPIAEPVSSRPPVPAGPLMDIGAGAGGEPEVSPISKARSGRVLVIDDEQAVCDLCRAVLEEAGHEVAVIQNSQAALDLVVERTFDVVLSDIRMPEITGVDLYRFLLEHCPLLVRRLVFITGDLANPETRRFLAKAKAGVIKKPFVARDLLGAVDAVLEREGRIA
ncbi:MAG: response regulator, partial [Nitrospirae bacterium]|nr:response regulator [Nitrospirota bacterium]